MVSAELEGAAVKVIGIDSHKATLAGCVVDELGTPVDERTLGNDRAGHAALADWARSLGVDRIGIEGSGRYGAAAARQLAAAGFDVRDVPPHLSHRERLRTHRPGKSDPTDALAIARVAAREQTLPPVRLADRSGSVSPVARRGPGGQGLDRVSEPPAGGHCRRRSRAWREANGPRALGALRALVPQA